MTGRMRRRRHNFKPAHTPPNGITMTRTAKVAMAVVSILLMACSVAPRNQPGPPPPQQPEPAKSDTTQPAPSTESIPYGLPAGPATIHGPTQVADGSSATFTASGFGYGERLKVWFDDILVIQDFADAKGNYVF